MNRGLAGGKAVSLIGAVEEEGKSNTLGRLRRVDVFFPPCLFPAGWGGGGLWA